MEWSLNKAEIPHLISALSCELSPGTDMPLLEVLHVLAQRQPAGIVQYYSVYVTVRRCAVRYHCLCVKVKMSVFSTHCCNLPIN